MSITYWPVNRSIPHISLHHVTRFEPITAAHFDQGHNNISYVYNYTVSQKNVLLSHCPYLRQILTNFHNSFTGTFYMKFAITRLLNIPPHLKCIATLPSEIYIFKNRYNRNKQFSSNFHALLLAIIVSFSYMYISQGSVATPLRCGGLFTNHFIADFPASVSVKECWKWLIFGKDVDDIEWDVFSRHRVEAIRWNECPKVQ